MKVSPGSNFFRLISLVILLLGAVGSLDMTLHAGRKNPSLLLQFLFGGWVLSPFLAYTLTNLASRRWTNARRNKMYLLSVAIGLLSVVAYSGYFTPSAKPASIFLIFPLISWLLLIAFLFSGKKPAA